MKVVFYALMMIGVCSVRLKQEKPKMTATFCPCRGNCGYGTALMCQAGAFAITRHDEGKCFKISGENIVSSHDPGEKGFDGLKFSGLRTDPGCEKFPAQAIARGKYGQGIDIRYVDEYYTTKVREELRAQYMSTPKPERDHWCQVVVHVRRGDVARQNQGFQCQDGSHDGRPTGCRWESIDVAKEAILKYFPEKQVCVISEGSANQYKVLTDITNSNGEKRVKLILNGAITYAFHQMATAPELMIAHSHFSYASAIFNPKGKIYYTAHSILQPLKEWIEMKDLEKFQKHNTYAERLPEVEWDDYSKLDADDFA